MFKKIVPCPIIRLFVGPGLLLFLVSFGLIACVSTGNRCEACGPPPGYNPDVTPMVDANGILYYIAHTTLYAFQDRSGTLLWHYTNPALDHDTPVVSDGKIYMDMNIVDSSNGNQSGEWVYGLSAGTGQVLWHMQISTSLPDIIPAEPQVIGGIVYTLSSGRTYGSSLFAMRASDGALLWQHTFPTCHAYSGPIVNATISISTICVSRGEEDAFQAETGELLWHFSLQDGLISTISTNTIVYVDDAANPSPGTDRFFALDAKTGQLLWKRDIPQQSAGADTRIWAANEGAVYTTMNGVWYGLAARDGKQLWEIPSSDRFGINSFAIINMQSWLLSPALVYVPANQQLNAFQASTGKLSWSFGLPDGELRNSITFFQGVIYLSARMLNQQTIQQNLLKQDIYAIQADTGKVLWHTTSVQQGQVMTQYGVYFAVVAGQPYHFTTDRRVMVKFSGTDAD